MSARSNGVLGTQRRATSLLVALAMLATVLPVTAASATHTEERRPQTLAVTGTQHVLVGEEPLPRNVDHPSVSADGTRVVFEGESTCRSGSGTYACMHLWLFEREPGAAHGTVGRLDLPLVDGDSPDDSARYPAISGDGRFVAFFSSATNLEGLAPRDADPVWKPAVLRYDLEERTLIQVDVHGEDVWPFGDREPGTAFREGAEWHRPGISHDGTRIAFTSPEDRGNDAVYVWDEGAGHAAPASVRADGGLPGGAYTWYPSLSPDGRWLAYQSPQDMGFVGDPADPAGFLDGDTQIWLQDLDRVGEAAPVLVSQYSGEPQGGEWPSVSDPVDPESLPYVSFSSWGVFEDDERAVHFEGIYRWDGNGGQDTFTWMSPVAEPSGSHGYPTPTNISADGSRVTFASSVNTLVDDDTNNARDVFVATLRDGEVTVERASVDSDGNESQVPQFWQDSAWGDAGPVLAADGSAVVYPSEAVLDREIGESDRAWVYLRDLADGAEGPEVPATFTASVQPLTPAPQAGSPSHVRLSFQDGFATPDTRHHYTLAWGDGTVAERVEFPRDAEAVDGGGAAGTIDVSHTYATAGEYTLQLTVHAADGPGLDRETVAEPRSVTVAPAPVLAIGPLGFSPATPEQGEEVTVTFTVTDSEIREPYSAVVDWGDGSPASDALRGLSPGASMPFTATHTYTQPGDYTVTATATAGDGTTASRGTTVTVSQVDDPPVEVVITGADPFPDGLQEGDEVGLEVFFGTDDDPRVVYEWEVLWDASETPPRTDGTAGVVTINDWEYGWQGSFVTHHTYVQDGTYLATVRIRPEGADGWTDSVDVGIEVANAAPRILDLGVSPDEGEAPLDVDLHAIFSDAGIEDAHVVTIDWGDGSTSSSSEGDDVSVVYDEGDEEWHVSASHTYLEAGEHLVTLVVTDGQDEDSSEQLVDVRSPDPTDATVALHHFGVVHPGSPTPLLVPQVKAGAREVPIASIPMAGIAESHGSVTAAPLHRVDIAATPLHRVPLHRVPLHRVDASGNSLEAEALRLGDLPLEMLPLHEVALTTVPLLRPGGWGELLAGTALAGRPLQTLTLADVHAAGLLADLTVEDVDLGATPFRDLSLAALLFGAVPLSALPVPEVAGSTATTWCERFAELGHPCGNLTEDAPLLVFEWAGLPVSKTGISATPLHRVPLHRVDLSATPLHRVPLHRVPLHRVDLQVSPLHRVPLHRVPLHRVDIAQTPLHRVPLHRVSPENLALLLDCSGGWCDPIGDRTLADAAEAGRLLETATLGLLTGALPEDLLVSDLIYLVLKALEDPDTDRDGLEFTLNDVLVGLLEAIDFPWEELPFGRLGVSRFAPYTGEAPLRYEVDFEVTGGPATPDAVIRLTLPEGFTVVTPEHADGPVGELVSPGDDLSGTVLVPLEVDGEDVTAVLEGHRQGTLRIEVRPGITLGTFTSDASITLATEGEGGIAPSHALHDQAAVTVVEHWEATADNAPATSPTLSSDTVYLAHLGTPGDIDYYRVPVTKPGQRISIRLTNLDADADLVLYHPVPQAAPLHRVSLGGEPVEDDGYGSDSTNQDLTPETLQDVPVRVSPLHRVSANRGDADEAVEAVATNADVSDGHYVIQVSGYNGAASDTPYVLRVRITDPLPAPECTNTFEHDAEMSITGWSSPTAATDTLVLFNEQRLRRLHDGGEVDGLVGALVDFLADGDHGTAPAVVALDQLSAVADAYEAWDEEGRGCDPAAANGVVEAITDHIDTLQDAHHSIANVVVVGGDDVVPFARVPDTTRLSQLTYADLVGDLNPISAAFATEHVLSDDPYGDAQGTPWLNRKLHVSEIAVGRLVESPTDIAAQLRQFVASSGWLDPDSALVTAYDFLTDGGEAVAEGLAKAAPDRQQITPDTLISETWSRQDVVDGLFPADESPSPGIASINAHYDHFRSLPAAPHAEHSEEDDELFTIEDIERDRLVGRILFTMGCHAGLAVPDRYVGSQAGIAEDWAQTLGRELAVFVANTGYGYGDDTAVALSELLMAELAERLDGTMTIGDALAASKHAYLGQMGVYGSYDEKVIQQTVLYGLPMYRIGSAPEIEEEAGLDGMATFGVTSAGGAALPIDPATGLLVAPVGIAPGAAGFDPVDTERGTYWQLPGQAPQVTHWRPIQPKAVLDVTHDGVEARGALITGLASADELNVDAVFARPAVGPAAHEPEVESGGVAFPARLSNLTTTGGPEGHRDRLALLPGQFFSELDTGSTLGVQRLYTRMDALVYYGEPGDADVIPPQISRAEAVTDDGLVGFTVQTDDPSGVKRVLVLFKDATGRWTALDLQDADGTWTGAATADIGGDPTAPELEWFVQAVDGAGNVAASTNKGGMFPAVGVSEDPDEGGTSPIPAPGPQAPDVDGPLGEHGWYTGHVTVTGDGIGTITFTEDGIHPVTVTRDGSSATYFVPIDQTEPTVQVTSPTESQQVEPDDPLTASFTCSDATSGVATCTAAVVAPDGSNTPVRDGGALPTSTLGDHELVVRARDRAGHTTEVIRRYAVAEPSELEQYRFDGFYKPIENDVVNGVKAGQSVPVKFRLFDRDTSVGDVSKVGVLVQPSVGCESGQSTNPVDETVPASAGEGLRWDAADEQFLYIHRTDRRWQGNCGTVRFTISHPDGSTTTELVRFRYTK